MKKYALLFPFLFILTNILGIYFIDKKLHYNNDVSLNSEGIYISENQKVGRTRVFLTTNNNIEFKRKYTSFLTRICARKYYNSLKEQNIYQVNFYSFDFDRNNENPFFNLGKGEEKNSFYYLDILIYIKQKCRVYFWAFWLLTVILLFRTGRGKAKANNYAKVFSLICLLIALYLIL